MQPGAGTVDLITPVETSFHVRGLELAALCWGDASRPPLLMLHGWMDNAQSYAWLAPLIKDRYVIAADFAGHGHSDHRPSGASYYMSEYTIDLALLIDQISSDPIDVAGHSMGAGVASLLAGTSSRIRKLVLIDGIGPMAASAAQSPEDLAKAIEQTADQELRSDSQSANRTLPELIARRAKASPNIPKDFLALMVERNARGCGERWQWRTDSRLKNRSPMRFSEEAVRAILGKIECPVLYFHALEGLFVDQSLIDERLACLTQSDNLLIKHLNGPHHLHLSDAVDEVASEINSFIR